MINRLSVSVGPGRPRTAICGSIARYVNDECRCPECREAWALYHRLYRERLRYRRRRMGI